jgi:hypothetical protein
MKSLPRVNHQASCCSVLVSATSQEHTPVVERKTHLWERAEDELWFGDRLVASDHHVSTVVVSGTRHRLPRKDERQLLKRRRLTPISRVDGADARLSRIPLAEDPRRILRTRIALDVEADASTSAHLLLQARHAAKAGRGEERVPGLIIRERRPVGKSLYGQDEISLVLASILCSFISALALENSPEGSNCSAEGSTWVDEKSDGPALLLAKLIKAGYLNPAAAQQFLRSAVQTPTRGCDQLQWSVESYAILIPWKGVRLTRR